MGLDTSSVQSPMVSALFWKSWVITARNSSCGKVMFSQASVSHTVWEWGAGGISGTNIQGSGFVQMSRRAGMFGGWNVQMSRGGYVQGRVGTHPPPLLTHIGSHHTCGQQVDSTHPTGMLSCCVNIHTMVNSVKKQGPLVCSFYKQNLKNLWT